MGVLLSLLVSPEVLRLGSWGGCLPSAGVFPMPGVGALRVEAGQNPHPAPQMQIGPRFRIRTAIDNAEANGVNTPLIYDSCQFCLLYHLKGVCNTHCGSRHLHRPLSQREFGRLCNWREFFCSGDEAPQVQEVDTGI